MQSARDAVNWEMVRHSLAQPYRVSPSMVLFLVLIPLYILIPAFFPPAERYAPELTIDRALPLIPSWSIVYGALYLFLIVLPIVVVRHDGLIQRMVYAFLATWSTAYLFFFLLYPTVAPRPESVSGEGFGVWGLKGLYSSDPPYNCFPSLHVAHSFVSALACSRVHRRLGIIALVCATLVAISTVFTKQHYVLDVVAGVALAFAAYAVFLRPFPSEAISAFDRQAAPSLALYVGAVIALGLGGFIVLYILAGETQFTFGP